MQYDTGGYSLLQYKDTHSTKANH